MKKRIGIFVIFWLALDLGFRPLQAQVPYGAPSGGAHRPTMFTALVTGQGPIVEVDLTRYSKNIFLSVTGNCSPSAVLTDSVNTSDTANVTTNIAKAPAIAAGGSKSYSGFNVNRIWLKANNDSVTTNCTCSGESYD